MKNKYRSCTSVSTITATRQPCHYYCRGCVSGVAVEEVRGNSSRQRCAVSSTCHRDDYTSANFGLMACCINGTTDVNPRTWRIKPGRSTRLLEPRWPELEDGRRSFMRCMGQESFFTTTSMKPRLARVVKKMP